MSIIGAILFLTFILMCIVFCWGHINGYRAACRRYQIHEDINNSDPW